MRATLTVFGVPQRTKERENAHSNRTRWFAAATDEITDRQYDAGKISFDELAREQDVAALDSIRRSEATGEPIVSDGEQRASSFATYPLTDMLAGTGLANNLAGGGQYFAIFDDGHQRQLPRLTSGPFRDTPYAAEFLEKALKIATKPLKQAVIAPSMLMLLYPLDGEMAGYSRDQFLNDLIDEARICGVRKSPQTPVT